MHKFQFILDYLQKIYIQGQKFTYANPKNKLKFPSQDTFGIQLLE